MMNLINKVPLLNDPINTYTGCDFSMCKYRLLQPSKSQIVEYDINKKKTKTVVVASPFSSISKYYNEELFYMAKSNDKKHLFKTNCNYEELDSLTLKIPNNYIAKINSIFFNHKSNKILITNDNKVYSVNKEGNFIMSEISPNSINTLLNNNNGYYANSCCPCNNPCRKSINRFTCAGYFCNDLYVAYTKDGSAYLGHISPNGNIISTCYIDDDIIINSIFNVGGNLQLLITKSGKYNYIYITDIRCCKKITNENSTINNEYIECPSSNNNCDFIEINSNCHNSTNANTDVIESIALIEAGISHILNAEGEKIQKAVALADNTCELLQVNDSVNQIIKSITFLEHILYNKLEVSKKCDSCENDDNCFI